MGACGTAGDLRGTVAVVRLWEVTPVRFRPPRPSADPLLAAAEAAEALFTAGRYEPASEAFAACIGQHQAALPQHLDDIAFNGRIGGLLNNLGLCLDRLQRYDEAVEVLQAAVAVFDGLSRLDDPDRWRPFIAGTLQTLAGALGKSGRHDRALTVSREAVELRRAGPGGGYDDPELAKALRMFALVRGLARTELGDAEQALDEALRVHMAVLSARAEDGYVEEIYTTYGAMALIFREQGRDDEARVLTDLARSRHLDGLPATIRAQRSR